MPDFAAHHLFGDRLKPPEAAAKYPILYRWGLQGPDLLFYRKVLTGSPPYSKIAGRMHQEHTEQLLASMALYCRREAGEDRERAEAYLYGFAGHYAMDSTVHPYVAAQQELLRSQRPGLSPSTLHGQIESDMDMDLWGLLRGCSVCALNPRELYTLDSQGQRAVGALYTHLLYDVYRTLISPREIAASLRDTLEVQQILYSGAGAVSAIAALLDRFRGRDRYLSSHIKGRQPQWDCLNLNGSPWTNPWTGEKRRQSVLQLMEEAAEQYQRLCCVLERNVKGAVLAIPADRNFSGKLLETQRNL